MKKVKCTVIGDFSVGKTSVIYSFLGKPLKNVQSTLGIDFFTKSIRVKGEKIILTIWDTAGAERFHSLTDSYLRGSDLVIVMYDMTKHSSNITQWMRKAEQHKPNIIGVLGNKDDLTPSFNGDLHNILFPWTRQNWKIVTGYCSSRRPESVKNFFTRCLVSHLGNEIESPELIPIVSINAKKTKNRTCCS
jgi:Rab family protein